MRRRTLLTTSLAAAALPVRCTHAATYPSRPIKLIVPFAPGGSVDFVSRIVVGSLSQHLGQPIIIDNRGGAGGAIGTMEVVRAPADGYTLLMASLSVWAIPAINPKAGYDPIKDLTPIVNVAGGAQILCVRSGFPARNFREFVAEVKRNPGRYTYGTPGIGGIAHLQIELFKLLTGTSIVHIPFRGAGPALIAVTAGQVDVIADGITSALPFIKDGRLIPLVLTSPARLSVLPDVPTFAEVGLPALNFMNHYGLLGPKDLPLDIVQKINEATRQAGIDPTVKSKIEGGGAMVVAGSPQEFAKEIQDIYTALRRVVVERKLTMD